MSDASNQNQIELVNGQGTGLAQGLRSLRSTLMDVARANIERAIEESSGNVDDYTDLNMRAMVVTEALRLTAGLDLSTILTRGDFIKQIEDEGLVGVHPNGYANLSVLARDAGIASVTELSNIRTLCEIIFPYIQDVLGWDLNATWEKFGKSNFFELVPALRSMITGENADHETVRGAVEQMLDNSVAEIAVNAGVEANQIDEGEVRRNAVESLLRGAAGRTNREVRRMVRPSRTPAVSMATLRVDEQWFAVLDIRTQEQYDLVQRILNAHANNQVIDGRQLTPAQRRFLRQVFGDTE